MVARTINVVQMLPDLNEGGVEQGTLEIGRALNRSGHSSVVISRGGRLVSQLEADGSTHITMPYIGEKSPRCLLHIRALRKLFINSRIDILHLRSRLPAWVAYAAWKSLPKHYRPHLVTTFHGFYSVNGYSAIMAKGEKVIAVSKIMADHIHSVYHVPQNRITVIYRGVDPQSLDPQRISDERIHHLQHLWGVQDTPDPVLLIPARITRLKGHDLLLRALGRLSHLKWCLICAGDYEPDSDYFQQLSKLSKELNIASQVKFVGHCSDMPAAIRMADLVISASSKPESFGRTMIEAQVLERAVIAPAHGGSLETLTPNMTGWHFAPNDAESLARVLKDALENKIMTEQFGRQGRQRVLERFTLSRMCDATIDLYKALLAQ